MMTEKLVKLAGIGLIASGILATIGFSIHPHDPSGANFVLWIGGHVLIFLGFLAGFLGLVGLYGVVVKAVGVPGFIGFLLASMSIALYLGKLYWSGFIYPLVIEHHPSFIADHGLEPGSYPSDAVVRWTFYLGPILFGVGYAVLGWAIVKSAIFPAFPVWLVIAGALLVGLWPLLPAVVQHFSVFVSLVFAIGIAWLGFLMASGRYRKC